MSSKFGDPIPQSNNAGNSPSMKTGGDEIQKQIEHLQDKLPEGSLTTYRDLNNIRKYEFPDIIVCEPKIKGGVSKHVEYLVKGKDHLGEFEVPRRYKQFYMFREVLVQRFVGLYIPPMPPKKKLVWYILSY